MAGNYREHGWADDLLARDRVGVVLTSEQSAIRGRQQSGGVVSRNSRAAGGRSCCRRG